MIFIIIILLTLGAGYYVGFWIGRESALLSAERNIRGFMASMSALDQSYFNMLAQDYNKAQVPTAKPKDSKLSIVSDDPNKV